jgi:hypothetical protein
LHRFTAGVLPRYIVPQSKVMCKKRGRDTNDRRNKSKAVPIIGRLRSPLLLGEANPQYKLPQLQLVPAL